MGWREALGMTKTADRIEAGLSAITDPSTFPIATPFGSSQTLQRIVYEDIFGDDVPINTRAAAMRIPAVARGRNLFVSTISRLPLVGNTAAGPLPVQPTWMSRTDDGVPPQVRLAWTVDDLLFYGWSCWWRTNGADGFPLSMSRINQGDWSIDDDYRVIVDGVPVDPRNVIVFQGLHEGVLTFGYDVLSDAKALYKAVRQRLTNPIPALDLHQTAGEQLTDDEIDALIDDWAAARAGANGGVAYSSEGIEVKELGGGNDAQLMIEARNAASLDLARMVGVSANRIDATSAKSSLNYETTTGRNQEFVDFDLALYMTPITARLSLDDVMPRGQSCEFNLTDFIAAAPSLTGPARED